jgi:CNT family concentrative nucleoside transporter
MALPDNGVVSELNLIALFGCGVLMVLAWLLGGCRRPVPWRTVSGSVLLLLVLATLVFWLKQTRTLLIWLNDTVLAVLARGNAGAEFLLGPLAAGPGQTTASGEPSIGVVLAAQVFPVLIFFAALMAVLYHFKLIQPVVLLFSRVFRRTLGLSGAEALAGGSNIFFGLESAITIRPYLERMTRSELLTLLVCGMSTVASTTLALYVIFLKETFPLIAGHLISASFLSIPCAALVSKLMLPETGTPETAGAVPALATSERHGNWLAALSSGATDGLRLAAGVATLLIAILGMVGLLDLLLETLSTPFVASFGGPLTLARILGWLFTPLAWLLGIETADLQQAGQLLGQRLIMTEVLAYKELASLSAAGAVSSRTVLVLSYALCGFTHIASVGIFVGGIAALVPSRRDDLASLGWRALAGATLATLLTGAIAGLFYHGQGGLLGL